MKELRMFLRMGRSSVWLEYTVHKMGQLGTKLKTKQNRTLGPDFKGYDRACSYLFRQLGMEVFKQGYYKIRLLFVGQYL